VLPPLSGKKLRAGDGLEAGPLKGLVEFAQTLRPPLRHRAVDVVNRVGHMIDFKDVLEEGIRALGSRYDSAVPVVQTSEGSSLIIAKLFMRRFRARLVSVGEAIKGRGGNLR
jgi:hypothetical protein